MKVDPLTGRVEFENDGRKFWTFGNTIRGTLMLNSTSKHGLHIKVAQGSILCEEWVHTVDIEFKEHYRYSKSLLDPCCDVACLNPLGNLAIPFELTVPHGLRHRYPPSFSFKYNNVAWSVKFIVGYTSQGFEDYYTLQLERGFRVCTLPPRSISRLSITELAAERSDHLWSPQYRDFVLQGAESPNIILEGSIREDLSNVELAKKKLVNCGLNFKLSLYRYGVPQDSSSSNVDMGMRLTAISKETCDICIRRVNTEISEIMHTFGKDTQSSHKTVASRAYILLLEKGSNELDPFVQGLRVSDLTEDFETDWQQVTHRLKLTFEIGFMGNKEVYCLVWALPITILSEAEFGTL